MGKGTTAALTAAAARQEQCIALCDYYSARDDEISFKKGDVITVVSKGNDSGFWNGFVSDTTLTGSKKAKKENNSSAEPSSPLGGGQPRTGLFPNCMVTSNCRLRLGSKFVNRAVALFDYNPRDNAEMRLEKGDVVIFSGPSASPGWWLGINQSASNRMIASDAHADPVAVGAVCGSESKPLLFPTNFISCDVVVAMFAFASRLKHELSFEAGDVLVVKRKWNDGWWEATLNGRRGIFPSNYTDPNVCTTHPPLFCSTCKTVYGPVVTASGGVGAAAMAATTSNDCKHCARNYELVSTMKRALEDYAGETRVLDRYNLFEYIDLDPKVAGRAALLTTADIIKSAGGGVEKGVSGASTSIAALNFSHGVAADPDQMRINDDEIFNRRGEIKSVLERERERAQSTHSDNGGKKGGGGKRRLGGGAAAAAGDQAPSSGTTSPVDE